MAARRYEERTQARAAAISLLYSGDMVERRADEIVAEGLYIDSEIALSDYAEFLISGVCANLDVIDATLSEASENWSLERMPAVDRAILRMAVFEMMFVSEVPVSVSINEAVDLAKQYGGDDESSRFVNGILGRIARSWEEESAQAAPQADEAAQPEGDSAQTDA